MLSLTESLAVEWAPKVRVAGIIAGLIQTEQAELHYGDQESIDRANSLGVTAYITKPVQSAEMAMTIENVLNKKPSA